ncbi:MAG: DoxX family protein [Mycobacteriales bacterium]
MKTSVSGRRMTGPWRSYLPWLVAAAFSVSGVLHLVHPATFTPIVPHFLPLPTELVYASGVAELICAVGLWRRDRWAGVAAAVLLLLIWPANIQDAVTTSRQAHDVTGQLLLWIRVPVQIPLIWFVLQSGRTNAPGAAGNRAETSPNAPPVPGQGCHDVA